jgi:hypothetical protein
MKGMKFGELMLNLKALEDGVVDPLATVTVDGKPFRCVKVRVDRALFQPTTTSVDFRSEDEGDKP